jgi:hypothetical protein
MSPQNSQTKFFHHSIAHCKFASVAAAHLLHQRRYLCILDEPKSGCEINHAYGQRSVAADAQVSILHLFPTM